MGLSPQWPVCGVARDAGTKDNIVKRNVFKVVQATWGHFEVVRPWERQPSPARGQLHDKSLLWNLTTGRLF